LRLVSGDPLPIRVPTPATGAAVAISKADNPVTFADIVALFVANREPLLAEQLRSLVHPVAVRPGVLELSLVEGAPPGLTGQIGRALTKWCGTCWQVVTVQVSCEPTLVEREAAKEAARWQAALAHPEVMAALEVWPELEPLAIIPPPEPEPMPQEDAAPPPLDAASGFDPRHDSDEIPLIDDEWAPFELFR
jgi:DNA polymerase-3 subunit gamma/tau